MSFCIARGGGAPLPLLLPPLALGFFPLATSFPAPPPSRSTPLSLSAPFLLLGASTFAVMELEKASSRNSVCAVTITESPSSSEKKSLNGSASWSSSANAAASAATNSCALSSPLSESSTSATFFLP